MNNKVLVMGIGNLLMGDEGVGIHVIREFEKENKFPFVDTLDGGTGGFHLLSYLHDYKRVIIIDAALGDEIAGTVKVIKPKYSSDFPRTLSAHDIGLKDLLDSAQLIGELPDLTLIIIYIDKFQTLDLELSVEVKKAIPVAIQKLNEILENIKNDYN